MDQETTTIPAVKFPAKIFLIPIFMFSLASCRVPLKKPAIEMNGTVPTIDWGRLAEYAVACGRTYGPATAVEAAYGKGNVIIRDLPNSEGHYFVYFNHAEKTQTVAVRGTSNKANALSDIDAIKLPDLGSGIFLHRGFRIAASDLYADLTPLLQPDYKTRVTGHSLGGAIAVICAMYLLKDGYSVDQVLTFGQPKVTNEEGGKKWAFPFFRVINAGDVVAQVPPSTIEYDFSGPYEHFGPEITLGADKTFQYSPVHIGRDLLADDLWKTIKPADVQDHQIQYYIERIKALK